MLYLVLNLHIHFLEREVFILQFGKVISFKNFKHHLTSIRKDLILIIFALLFIVGFFIGIFSYKKYDTIVSVFKDVVDNFIRLRSEGTTFKIVLYSFLNKFTYLTLMFFFGTSVLGLAVLPFVSIYCGVYYGGLFAGFYSIYSLKGISYSMVFVLPCAVIFSAVLMKSSNESVLFSLKTSRLTFTNSVTYSLYYEFKNYCNRYIIFTIILIFISLIDSLISNYFRNIIML